MAHYQDTETSISNHARERMAVRSITEWHIEQVMRYGRSSHTRKAVIYVIGRKEVKTNGRFLEQCEGIHVLCSRVDGAVITTYRNHNLKSLRH